MYPRDLAGYGRNPPDARWPNDARLAVQFVINFEEGGEHSILHGDRHSEAFLAEEPTAAFYNVRNLGVESQYEYGSRAGWWRLYRMFTERNIPVTIFGITKALEKNPDAVAAMKEAKFEIASHGLRWIHYAEMPEEQEALHIAEAMRIHTEVTGARPTGWYTGRMSVNTRKLLVLAGGLVYDSDSFADDLPYWVQVDGQDHLVVPYTLDNNDVRYVNSYGYQSPSFSAYLTQAFEFLRREGERKPKMMSIGLHTRLVGRPGRAADLERFLDHVAATSDVWVARRIDIAEHWRAAHPPASQY
ncbi:allantoinase PuuE [Pseudaminobacter sp. 19-2017]|uniref:Chitooligosaccharide deacetylase n=1 Tax=Pseudaminobacter soli (ex Zhang et al. 2022) TaxID=2831468 RepID=A0A942E5Q7_9HYPH|nr:allantoinase PuuE [Pseudaminobacter soli]MBS3651030.1 allantoinase PuuE [Pseudaminobacter soli]